MTLEYFNHIHILTILLTAGFILIFYFTLRNRSMFAKDVALFILMGFNLSQHLFKFAFWPHLWGTGFGLINTAYNVCAIFIISSPFIYLNKSALLKQFVAYVGTIGATITIIFPQWFIGIKIFSWEFWRFWTCHTLLASTSILPALWGMVKFDYRDGWKFGLIFLLMLSLILTNNTVFTLAFGDATPQTLYDALLNQNPLWMMSPSGGFEKLKPVFEAMSPSIFLETDTHPYIPILWYAIPMYLMITVLAYLFGAVLDRKRLFGETKTMIKFNKPACRL